MTVLIGALKKKSSKFVLKLVTLLGIFFPIKQKMIDPNDRRGFETICFEKLVM